MLSEEAYIEISIHVSWYWPGWAMFVCFNHVILMHYLVGNQSNRASIRRSQSIDSLTPVTNQSNQEEPAAQSRNTPKSGWTFKCFYVCLQTKIASKFNYEILHVILLLLLYCRRWTLFGYRQIQLAWKFTDRRWSLQRWKESRPASSSAIAQSMLSI